MQINTLFDLEQIVPFQGEDCRIMEIHVNGMPGNPIISYDLIAIETDEEYPVVKEADLISQP